MESCEHISNDLFNIKYVHTCQLLLRLYAMSIHEIHIYTAMMFDTLNNINI